MAELETRLRVEEIRSLTQSGAFEPRESVVALAGAKAQRRLIGAENADIR